MARRKESVIIETGKRKKAIARVYLKKGKGNITVNGKTIEGYFPNYIYLKAYEPIKLAGDNVVKSIDIKVRVEGGGITGQVDAVRQAIARAIIEYTGDENLEKRYISYDRSLLVFDPRRTEPHKPSRSKQGPRRKKQLSKR